MASNKAVAADVSLGVSLFGVSSCCVAVIVALVALGVLASAYLAHWVGVSSGVPSHFVAGALKWAKWSGMTAASGVGITVAGALVNFCIYRKI